MIYTNMEGHCAIWKKSGKYYMQIVIWMYHPINNSNKSKQVRNFITNDN